MSRQREDSAEGCRSMASDDQQRADESGNPQMRAILERSAAAWESRAKLLDRLEASSAARAQASSEAANAVNPLAVDDSDHDRSSPN
ncbi:MAG TPA: hypothetical protein VM308_03120 [Sphingomicrobium sp.]|nr:hypothetical protein [Sphingomicrobium sp.]